jgi:hypothetical protein
MGGGGLRRMAEGTLDIPLHVLFLDGETNLLFVVEINETILKQILFSTAFPHNKTKNFYFK